MTRRNIVGMLLSRFDYNRVTVTIVHISVRERLQNVLMFIVPAILGTAILVLTAVDLL